MLENTHQPQDGRAVRGLTVRQPWAWAIADGFKPVENRTRRTHYRGTVLIHAGRSIDTWAARVLPSRQAAERLDELGGYASFWDAGKTVSHAHTTLALGAVIALAELTDCHRDEGCCRPWGEPGAWHWRLSTVRPLPAALPYKGALGLWIPSPEVRKTVLTQAGQPHPPTGELTA